MVSYNFFYQPPNEIGIFHINCKIILQDFQISENFIWENIHDFEFFYIASNASYHVKCKLLSHSSIIDILNKKKYGIDFDANELKRKYVMDLHQKKNLELNLKQILEQILKRFV
jgi:hypothetical protein